MRTKLRVPGSFSAMISNKLFAFLFCFLYLEQVADDIWPVIKQDCMEAPTITSKLRLYVKVLGKQGNSARENTSGRHGVWAV